MSGALTMDVLIEMPAKVDLVSLRDLYRRSLPQSLDAFCLLESYIDQPELRQAFNVSVFCPGGDVNKGMVVISDKEHYYEVYLCPIADNMNPLENALLATKVIDWSRLVSVPSTKPKLQEMLKRVSNQLSLTIHNNPDSSQYIIRSGSRNMELHSCPKNTYTAPLKPEHIDLVDSLWTFYLPGHTRQLFETLICFDRSYALYSTGNDKLIAWVFVDASGSLTHLFCLDEYRRKGYAEYITKVAVNDILKKGKNVLAYTWKTNLSSQNLLKKIGFIYVEPVSWVFLSKEKSSCMSLK